MELIEGEKYILSAGNFVPINIGMGIQHQFIRQYGALVIHAPLRAECGQRDGAAGKLVGSQQSGVIFVLFVKPALRGKIGAVLLSLLYTGMNDAPVFVEPQRIVVGQAVLVKIGDITIDAVITQNANVLRRRRLFRFASGAQERKRQAQREARNPFHKRQPPHC